MFYLLLLLLFACTEEKDESLKYLNQTSPSLKPEIFAPGLISYDDQSEFGSVFNEKGTEFYYGVDVEGKSEIRFTKLLNNSWTEPASIISHEFYSYNDPFLSPDETRLYFISDMAMNGVGDKKDFDIWYVEKKEDGWSEPINAGSNINSEANEYYMSFSENGSMYFSSNLAAKKDRPFNYDVYYSKKENRNFQKPFKLDNSINTDRYEADVFIDPDESYMIFCADRKEGLGKGDLYISFKNTDGDWIEVKNMGRLINTEYHELCPFVSKDGKYFFFTRNKDIYWVDAGVIENYRN